MPFTAGGLRVLRSLIVTLLLSLYLPAAFPASGKLLELWFEFDGHPVKLDSDPELHCYRQPGMQPFACSLYKSDDGRYWVTRPEPGRYLLRVSVDANRANSPALPGDLYRDYPFRVDRSTTGPLLISLHRLLALQQPQSNAAALSGQSGGCKGKPSYSAAILALFPSAQIDFAWQPVADDASYQYTLWRVRCSDGMRLEQVFYRQTTKSMVTEAIPPNEAGQYYQLELKAVSDNQTIGELMLHDGNGGSVGEYRFVVRDPLIDRSWLYYALGLLTLLFVGWVVIGALRSRPPAPPAATDHKPSGLWRPTVLTLLLLGAGTAGYLQREPLISWLEQGKPELQRLAQNTEEWLRSAGSTTEAVAATPMAEAKAPSGALARDSGEWRGVIVSASDTPFVGSSRRAEVRVRLGSGGAQVFFRQGDQWLDVTGSRFIRQPSGEGMTLFGHRRGPDYSELWSISIPDTSAMEWPMAIDRIITYRNAGGEVISSERRRASGELHASAN